MASDKTTDFQSSSTAVRAVDWTNFLPKSVDSEDTLGPEENKRVWEDLYRKSGMVTAGEDERRMVRAAVYMYCLKNGTSREGDYSGKMVLYNGRSVAASVIPAAASKMKIRKFLRANMAESYQYFKSTRVAESDERFVAKCAALGIAAECAFATADWMSECPTFTPAESRAHDTAFVRGIDRARRARNGKSLEAVESGRLDDQMTVQGPKNEQYGNTIEF